MNRLMEDDVLTIELSAEHQSVALFKQNKTSKLYVSSTYRN